MILKVLLGWHFNMQSLLCKRDFLMYFGTWMNGFCALTRLANLSTDFLPQDHLYYICSVMLGYQRVNPVAWHGISRFYSVGAKTCIHMNHWKPHKRTMLLFAFAIACWYSSRYNNTNSTARKGCVVWIIREIYRTSIIDADKRHKNKCAGKRIIQRL